MLRDTLHELFRQWRPAFRQQRICERAIDLAVGLLCGMGRRTITRAICFLGLQFQEWSAHYKLFSRSKWEPGELFAPVIKEAVPRYCGSLIAITFDDTLLKRTGKKPSTHFRRMVTGLRKALDDAGHAAKTLVAVVDCSYCNAVTFAASLGERIALLARCRENIRLCHPAPAGGRRIYGEEKFTPEDVARQSQDDGDRRAGEAELFVVIAGRLL